MPEICEICEINPAIGVVGGFALCRECVEAGTRLLATYGAGLDDTEIEVEVEVNDVA